MNPVVPGSPEAAQLSGYLDVHSKMRESADISKIAPALVRAQASMQNPPRNRSVQVRTQTGSSYTFRYATLDKIADCLRTPLAENGLCVLQPVVATERGQFLLTRLLHESGQWMECEVGLPSMGSQPQAFGSVVTYVRRYAISALLNISADEDDDANRAAGNHVQDEPMQPSPRGGKAKQQQQREIGAAEAATSPAAASVAGSVAVRRLVDLARQAGSVDDGHKLLAAFVAASGEVERERGWSGWGEFEKELGAGLKRSLGPEPAAAFVAALRATAPEQIKALQGHWEGKWADTLSAMQQEAPATYALLRRHVTAGIARVRGETASGKAPAAATVDQVTDQVTDQATGQATGQAAKSRTEAAAKAEPAGGAAPDPKPVSTAAYERASAFVASTIEHLHGLLIDDDLREMMYNVAFARQVERLVEYPELAAEVQEALDATKARLKIRGAA